MDYQLALIAGRYRDQICRTAKELIRIPSYSLHEKELADYVEEKMRCIGYDEVYRDPYGSVFGVIFGREPERGCSVMLNCHMDTVEEGSPSLWKYPPFEGVEAEGRIWGRGASDTKGTMAVQLYAPVMLREAGLLSCGKVVTAAVVAEEIAGFGSMMQCRDGFLLTDYAIMGEATENQIAIANRGRCCVQITVSGKACHASIPETGCSPFPYIAHLLARLGEIPLSSDTVLGCTSIHPTKIESSEQGTNLIPNRIVLYCDVRQSAGDTDDVVLKKFQKLLSSIDEPGVSAKAEILSFPLTTYTGFLGIGHQGEPPFSVPTDENYIQKCRKALEEAVGHPIETKLWGFATDAGHYAARGVRVFGYSPAEIRYCHSADDSISIAMMEEATIGYMSLLRVLTGEEIEM